MTDINNAEATAVNFIDAAIADATENVAKAQAKLDKLVSERDNREALASLGAGDTISFNYGRGDKRRTLSGSIVATGNDEKQGLMMAVNVGEGLDVQTYKIRASDVVLGTDTEE